MAGAAAVCGLVLALALLVPPAVLPARADDAAAGSALFASHCAVCHTVVPEYHKEGPSLAGVYGRRAGTAPFFAGYKALKGADFTWDDRSLNAWLTDPRAYTGKDTAMTVKIDDPAQRAALIAYLRTLH